MLIKVSHFNILIFAIIILILSACQLKLLSKVIPVKTTSQPPVADQELNSAQLALDNFLNSLTQKQFSRTVTYYGGSYAELESLNGGIKPEFKAKFWEKFCLVNKGVCLPFEITSSNNDNGQYKFIVQYLKDTGSLFVTPGCTCKNGGRDSFEFTVQKNDGQYKVMNLPPFNKE